VLGQSVSINIPIYNNKETIQEVILECIRIVSSITNDWEINLVDDGSTDGSKMIIDKIGKANERIKIFHHVTNMGFGPTLKEIFTLGSKKWIFFISADGQFLPSDLIKMWKQTENYDYILGIREKRNDSFFRRVNSKIYNLIISIISKKRTKDVNSIVLFKRDILSKIQLKSNSAFVHAELYMKTIKNNFKMTEVKVFHKKRMHGRGGGGKLNVILKTAHDLVKYILGKI